MPIPRHSRAAADLPALPLQPGERKHQWVYRQIVSAIEGGLLRPGDTVPSTRVLAARWGTSRGVVELVFEQLNHEGYLHAMAGKGTRVNDPLPDSFLCAQMSNETSHELVDSSQGDFEPAHAGVTPNPVRAGRRAALYETARQRNPLRWKGPTRNWQRVHAVHLNPDRIDNQGVAPNRQQQKKAA